MGYCQARFGRPRPAAADPPRRRTPGGCASRRPRSVCSGPDEGFRATARCPRAGPPVSRPLPEVKPMKNLLAFLAALILTVAGVGWYLGWFQVSTTPLAAGHKRVNIDIDTTKVANDLKEG